MDGSTGARVLLCYDGSVAAGAAIEVAARLLPHARAHVAFVWAPPFGSAALRHRLWHGTSEINEFVAAIEREGKAEATRLAAVGVALAAAYGWAAEPLVRRTYGGEGLQLAEIGGEIGADLIVLGSRGLGGAQAVLGSVSDLVVHYARCPVLVVPYPLLEAERAVLDVGPVVVGWDGSPGATAARQISARLFPGRPVVPVFVADGDERTARTIPGLVEAHHADGHLEHGRSTAAALAGQARALDAALVAVGSRGRSAVREILLGSVAMAMLHHVHRPVLVVPHRETPASPGTPP
ncbi:universal stress protein [Actinoplanes palleronii]|uniref:Universal stress protein n=1 Tax=Actinoplanes palleronii TaxID=113570 RepID=A0ABQ4BBV2_9ACTN|nr:universal stress protein [Actinoplanes palleronii]GIE68176.1 universal stress protein [Actinoplanes palleronii]